MKAALHSHCPRPIFLARDAQRVHDDIAPFKRTDQTDGDYFLEASHTFDCASPRHIDSDWAFGKEPFHLHETLYCGIAIDARPQLNCEDLIFRPSSGQTRLACWQIDHVHRVPNELVSLTDDLVVLPFYPLATFPDDTTPSSQLVQNIKTLELRVRIT